MDLFSAVVASRFDFFLSLTGLADLCISYLSEDARETKWHRWPDVQVEFVRLGPGVAQIGATKKRGIISKLVGCFLGFQVSSMFFKCPALAQMIQFDEYVLLPCFISFSTHLSCRISGDGTPFLVDRHFSIPTIHHDTELIDHGDPWDTHGNE